MTSRTEDSTPQNSGSKDQPPLADSPRKDLSKTANPEKAQYFDLLDSLGYLGRCEDANEMPQIEDAKRKSGDPEGGGPSRAGDPGPTP